MSTPRILESGDECHFDPPMVGNRGPARYTHQSHLCLDADRGKASHDGEVVRADLGHRRGRIYRVASGRGPPGPGESGPGRRQPGDRTPLQSGSSGRRLRMARRGPGRLPGLPEGGRGGLGDLPRGGDPERPPIGRPAHPLARERPDGHAPSPGGRPASRGPPIDLRGLQQRLRRYRGTAQARGDGPQPAQPLRRRQARGRALRPGLCPDDGPGRREPPLLQRLRAEARSVEPLQRGDLAVRPVDGGRNPARHLRRRPADPRFHLRGQRREGQPPGAAMHPGRWAARP